MATTPTITVRLADDEACAVFIALADNVSGELFDITGEPDEDWTDNALERIGGHARALAAYATALGLARIDLERARRRTVKPATIRRLEAIRAEFADDPEGIALLIDLARGQQDPAPAARTPAAAASTPR